jgi:hypothetical protein
MKKLALSVHALSSLYAKVITNIINPGFALVVQTSHYQEGSAALVVAEKQEKMASYLLNAEQKVIEFSRDVSDPSPTPSLFPSRMC